ncbi:MAG TPA: M50 family metallopeptidase [Terriglobales bacterium]|nr:M50 family metallopeptidase [Terriglobales bacterium]
MKILMSYARSMFWTVGIITLLTGLTFLPSFVRRAAGRPAWIVLWACFLFFMEGVGVITCLAARALKRQGRLAKTLVLLGSLYNLLIFPFGTVAGAVGIWWCLSKKLRDVEPLAEAFDYQSKKGDGTHKWIQIVVPAGSIVILLGSLRVATWWGEKHGLPRNAPINGLVLLFLCGWVSAFFHELGHTIAAWISGMKLAYFSVGPFMARKKGGRWKFGFTLAGFAGLGGAVSTVPLHLRDLRRRMALEVAGGPVASLLTAGIAMRVLLMMPGSAWVMWWKVTAVIAAISIAEVVINLIPVASAAGFSDGAVLVQLLGGGPFADMREALKTLGMTTVTPVRPRDLDATVMARRMNAAEGGPMADCVRMIGMICAVDRGDLALARGCLDSVLETVPHPDRTDSPGVAAELGYYIAYLDGHAGRAGQWLCGVETVAAKKKFPLASDFDYWRAVAAVRLAEGRQQEANDAWRRAKQLADCFPNVGLYEYERDMLNRVKDDGWLRLPEVSESETSASDPIMAIPVAK